MAALLSVARRRGGAALASSAVARWVRRVADEAAAIARRSRFAGATRRTDRAVRASWLYRWLTAEPDPDVVVIDLRETVVVGPILALCDRTLDPLARNWERARVGTVASRLSDRFVARPIRVVSVVALVAILATLLPLVALGSPSRNALGAGLVAASLALAGTRVRLSADELTETDAYELAVKLLSPPEPPERDEGDDRPPE